jgi:hypothetical protein
MKNNMKHLDHNFVPYCIVFIVMYMVAAQLIPNWIYFVLFILVGVASDPERALRSKRPYPYVTFFSGIATLAFAFLLEIDPSLRTGFCYLSFLGIVLSFLGIILRQINMKQDLAFVSRSLKQRKYRDNGTSSWNAQSYKTRIIRRRRGW